MSTSFSVASWTEQITSSFEGLMVSKVLPSIPLMNSLLMKLSRYSQPDSCIRVCIAVKRSQDDVEANLRSTHSPVGTSILLP